MVPWIITYLVAINLLTYILYGLDKRRSKRGRYRYSEKTLLTCTLMGGSLGALLAMRWFHHKNRKLKFIWTGWGSLALYSLLILMYCRGRYL